MTNNEKLQSIIYEGKQIKEAYPEPIRKGRCEACGRLRGEGEIKWTSRHHFKYAYELNTVRKNPLLALENSVELCWSDHQIADSLRE